MELQPVLSEINHAIDHLHSWMKPQHAATPLLLWGTSAEVRAELSRVRLQAIDAAPSIAANWRGGMWRIPASGATIRLNPGMNFPVATVIACRRRSDGGMFSGTEQDRLVLLRTAIAEGADYVDLEDDVAGGVPRFGKTKRIVSHHDRHRGPLRRVTKSVFHDIAQRPEEIIPRATNTDGLIGRDYLDRPPRIDRGGSEMRGNVGRDLV